MRRIYLIIILLFLLALEGVALDFLPTALVKGNSLIISHWVFLFSLYIALFFDTEKTYHGVIFATTFGLFTDMIYTNILGVYMFAYFVSTYLIFMIGRSIRINLIGIILLGIVGITVVDSLIYFIYYFINVISLPLENYAYYRLLPTVLANIIFLIILYPIFSKRLVRWQEKQLNL